MSTLLTTEDKHKILANDAMVFAKKKCMTTKFDENTGNVIPCTVLEIEPNYISQIISETDDSVSVKISGIHDKGGSEKSIINRIGKPLLGFCKKAGIKPTKLSMEFKSSTSKIRDVEVGQAIYADLFSDTANVDVFGTSKGKGYQGVMKLHGFAGGPASHGSSRFHRGRGSVGVGRSTPGRCFKGTKMASRMGGKSVVAENVHVVEILNQSALGFEPKIPGTMWMIVRGSIPGSNGSLVKIRAARKKMNK